MDRLSIVLVASEDLRNRDMNLRLISKQRFKLISLIPSIACLFRHHKLNTVPYYVKCVLVVALSFRQVVTHKLGLGYVDQNLTGVSVAKIRILETLFYRQKRFLIKLDRNV